MGPEAPTSKDAGGSKRRIRSAILNSRGDRIDRVSSIKHAARACEPTAGALELGALEPDGVGLLAAMVKDGDNVTGAAVVYCAADGSGTDRRFSLDDE